ncbi:hypothetical protein P2318_29225 [Myxococcaceae bacterium GXIMD 01537]
MADEQGKTRRPGWRMRAMAQRVKGWAGSVLHGPAAPEAGGPPPEPAPPAEAAPSAEAAPPGPGAPPAEAPEAGPPEHWARDVMERRGPPADWVARVRKGAPHLLTRLGMPTTPRRGPPEEPMSFTAPRAEVKTAPPVSPRPVPSAPVEAVAAPRPEVGPPEPEVGAPRAVSFLAPPSGEVRPSAPAPVTGRPAPERAPRPEGAARTWAAPEVPAKKGEPVEPATYLAPTPPKKVAEAAALIAPVPSVRPGATPTPRDVLQEAPLAEVGAPGAPPGRAPTGVAPPRERVEEISAAPAPEEAPVSGVTRASVLAPSLPGPVESPAYRALQASALEPAPRLQPRAPRVEAAPRAAHPWPELAEAEPLDDAEGGVALLREWSRQRRLDREQRGG